MTAALVLVGVPGKEDANNGNGVLVLMSVGWTVAIGLVDILAAESFNCVGAKSRRL